MTRLRGFSEVADAAEHVADFYTLTTPSRFHRTHMTGEPNEKYAGGTVRDAQGWLRQMWARARAKLKRLKVLIYGFRIAEPHHDGTPHWHMVLFTLARHRDTVRSVLTGFWLSDDGAERGALARRINVKAIDGHKGTAAGYLAKYVAKNIDGFEVGADHEGENAKATESCDRVTAWASRHGIRQFQQVGGPSVTVWRELRRIRSACSVASIEAARAHADVGEWAAFIGALGGIEAGRAGSVGLWSQVTGEINQYDEARGPQIVGVRSADGKITTRVKCWRIQRKVQGGPGCNDVRTSKHGHRDDGTERSVPSLGPVSITVRDITPGASPASWTNPNESSMYGPN